MNHDHPTCFYCNISLPKALDGSRELFEWHLSGHGEKKMTHQLLLDSFTLYGKITEQHAADILEKLIKYTVCK